VGGGEPGRDLAAYVLEPFAPEEEERIGPWLARAAEGVRAFLDEGPETAMNRFNRVPDEEPNPGKEEKE
jgi:peptidyl-tRNA hydrolase